MQGTSSKYFYNLKNPVGILMTDAHAVLEVVRVFPSCNPDMHVV